MTKGRRSIGSTPAAHAGVLAEQLGAVLAVCSVTVHTSSSAPLRIDVQGVSGPLKKGVNRQPPRGKVNSLRIDVQEVTHTDAFVRAPRTAPSARVQ